MLDIKYQCFYPVAVYECIGILPNLQFKVSVTYFNKVKFSRIKVKKKFTPAGEGGSGR